MWMQASLLLLAGVCLPFVQARYKVLLVLIDGCRWDYPHTDSTLKGFPKLAEMGVRAEYVLPIFPSNSYPNWYTLVTGRYAESHGFVQNLMYDSIHNDFFLMGPNESASVAHWWNNAEPIWITAEKNDIRTSLYWWDGCQVEIMGRRPTSCIPYKYVGDGWDTVDADTRNAFLEALHKFKNENVELVQIYYEPVDHKGHKYGPDSNERREAFRKIDTLLYELQEEMTRRGLEDQVNLIVVSDHGMTLGDPNKLNIINFENFIDSNDIKYMMCYGASSMILPEEGKEEKVYDDIKNSNLTGFKVYKKKDIPEKYHLKNSYLTLPILVVAEEGSYIRGLDLPGGKSVPTGSSVSRGGNHGYDPYVVKDMHTLFYARGPALKKGYVSPPIHNTDQYNLICRLLEIEPVPNNGSLKRIEGMFLETNDGPKSNTVQYAIVIFALACSICQQSTM